MLNRRSFATALFAFLTGCAKASQSPPEAALSLTSEPRLTDTEIQAFLKIVRQLPGQKLPTFQPISEVDLSSDRTAADMVARWQREFRSSYSPDVQAKLWKRDSALRSALSDLGVDSRDFATLLIELSTAVVRESLGPEIDLQALGRQADRSIASLSSQFDNLDHDPRLSPTVRNGRAEILTAVLRETIAYRELLTLLERVPPESVSAITPHREVLSRLMPPTETVQLFRKKLASEPPVTQASHESASHPATRAK